MKITILCVGRIKENHYQKACQFFINQISQHHSIDLIEVKDEPDSNTKGVEEEGKQILKRLPATDYVVALDIQGKAFTTTQFQKQFKKQSSVTYIIGGSNGLSDEVLKKAQSRISFSKMTFPHSLMRVILLEQISKY